MKKKRESLVKPKGFIISKSAIDIHGITQDYAETHGENISDVLNNFKQNLQEVEILVAHNINFHLNVILSECHRNGYEDIVEIINQKQKKCTMELGKLLLGEYPKLDDLYFYLFKEYVRKNYQMKDQNYGIDNIDNINYINNQR